jgi:Zn-dependent M28 family amino/carboxypeptidase
MYRIAALLLAAAVAAPCSAAPEDAITAARLLGHIKVLSSDEFEGRGPASNGEKKTVAYIEKQFRRMGLKPGNPDGSYLQQVAMQGITSTPALAIEIGGKPLPMQFPDDFTGYAVTPEKAVAGDKSELVFVGYGVLAPEYGWDDFKGADLKGKTLVMLINDPPAADPALFKGKAMTWYGRWDYKYHIAARLGAAAAIIVHETGPAGYPYDVVRNSWSRENFDLKRNAANPGFPPFAAWMTEQKARAIMTAAGQDFDALKKSAVSRDFRPVALGGHASFKVSNSVRDVMSHNVVARVAGTDPNEHVIYSAHWDHIGINASLPGPRSGKIYHGAVDNASGVAALLELARAHARAPRPKRSVLFIATTAEEQGLLGARYYVGNPLYPLDGAVADINIDGLNVWGRTEQIEDITAGHSTLEEMLAEAAAKQGRRVEPDTRPEKGFFYRADQLEFARKGIPVLYTKPGANFIGKGPDVLARSILRYIATDYHQVTDTVRPDWDLAGGVEDTRLLYAVGRTLAEGAPRPAWKPASEFAPRDK